MSAAPPYVQSVEQLASMIARTTTGAELDALWKSPGFRVAFDALPERGRKEVVAAGKAHRSLFTLGAG